MSELLRFAHLDKVFDGRKVLDDVTLGFGRTGFVGILGPSGSGKSTLLSLAGLLIRPERGSVLIEGEDTGLWDEKKRNAFRLGHMGYAVQKDELLGLFRAEENASLPLEILEEGGEKARKTALLLSGFHLREKEKQLVKNLSGGEKQRVNIARSMVHAPKILLLDEPTSALDEKKARELMEMLVRLAKTRLILMVSHDKNLLCRYVDRLIYLKDGKVVGDLRKGEGNQKPLFLEGIETRKAKPAIPGKEVIRYALRKKKEHKVRSFITESSVALGLLGFGLSIYISMSVGGEIERSFSRLIPPFTMVMEKKESAFFEDIRCADKEEISYLKTIFEEEIHGVGKSYLYPFEEAFPDDNSFYYQAGVSKKVLPLLNARSINDFLLLKGGGALYPSAVGELGKEEVILGLPFDMMAGLCKDFGLQKGYEALGRHLEQRPLPLEFRLANLRWGLDKGIPLSLVGVIESEIPICFHSDVRWNEKVFEGSFGFRDVGIEAPENPQESRTIPFVECRENPFDFLKKARKAKGCEQLLFDYPNGENAPSLCPLGERLDLSRFYVYASSSRGLSFSFLDEVMSSFPFIKGRLPIAGNFFGGVDSALSGFLGRFFLSPDASQIAEVEKAYADLPLEEANLVGEMPGKTLEGSLLSLGENGIRISADVSWIEEDLREGEVGLSKELFEKWGKPSSLFLSMEVGSETIGETLSRDFRRKEVKVKAVQEAPVNTLYVPSDWTVDFFVNDLRVSPLSLEPRGAIFYCDSKADLKKAVQEAMKRYPDYRFASPSASIKESLKETTDYLSSVLLLFSSISLFGSGALFAFVFFLVGSEGAKEERSLQVLGCSEKERRRFSCFGAFLHLGDGLLSASFTLLLMEAAVSYFLHRVFGGPFAFRFSLAPFLAMGVIASSAVFAFWLYGKLRRMGGLFKKRSVKK